MPREDKFTSSISALTSTSRDSVNLEDDDDFEFLIRAFLSLGAADARAETPASPSPSSSELAASSAIASVASSKASPSTWDMEGGDWDDCQSRTTPGGNTVSTAETSHWLITRCTSSSASVSLDKTLDPASPDSSKYS